MEVREGKIYIEQSEAVQLASRYCVGDLSFSACRYDSKENDFRNCRAYQLFSALDSKFEEAGNKIIAGFRGTEAVCPVLDAYGRPRSSNEEFQLVRIASPEVKPVRKNSGLELTDAMFNMRAQFYEESKRVVRN